jgi:hypothetical protein
MNSLDPWSVILTNPWDEVVVPSPFYGHSLYWEVPSWIHYGNGGGPYGHGYGNDNSSYDTHRRLFDGAFIGAVPPTEGISARKILDEKQVLHVEICVEGKCYRTSMNLAPAISLIMRELSKWHEAEHAQMRAQVSPTTVVGAIEAAVDEASRAIVGTLVGLEPVTTVGAFLPMALAAAAGAYGGMWWANQSWGHQLREAARRGENIYWNDQLLYVPSTL